MHGMFYLWTICVPDDNEGQTEDSIRSPGTGITIGCELELQLVVSSKCVLGK